MGLDSIVIDRAQQELEAFAMLLMEYLREVTTKHTSNSHRTIHDLPDEVLVKIFATVRVDARSEPCDYRLLLSLASVCRRFRNVINQHARFWTQLDNLFRPEAIATVIDRSKNARLHVILHHRENGPHASMHFLKAIGVALHRIYCLEVFFVDDGSQRSGSWRSIQEVLSTLAVLDLPLLEYFMLRVPPRSQGNVIEGNEDDPPPGIDDDIFAVYTGWNASSLDTIILSDVLPRAHAGFQLTTVDLFFSDSDWQAAQRPLTNLLSFLGSQPTLERFDIVIPHVPVEADFRWSELIHLPVLRCLRLTASTSDIQVTEISCAVKILQTLSTPSIHFLEVRIPADDANFRLETIFPPDRKYPKLEGLHLSILPMGGFLLRLSSFMTIFQRFPKLLNLALILPGAKIDGAIPSQSSQMPPPLRKLDLEFCEFLSMDMLELVLSYLARGPRWSEFQNLEIRYCPLLFMCIDELYSLIPSGKIYVEF